MYNIFLNILRALSFTLFLLSLPSISHSFSNSLKTLSWSEIWRKKIFNVDFWMAYQLHHGIHVAI